MKCILNIIVEYDLSSMMNVLEKIQDNSDIFDCK